LICRRAKIPSTSFRYVNKNQERPPLPAALSASFSARRDDWPRKAGIAVSGLTVADQSPGGARWDEYKRALAVIGTLNAMFRDPLGQHKGRSGVGGAVLTVRGRRGAALYGIRGRCHNSRCTRLDLRLQGMLRGLSDRK